MYLEEAYLDRIVEKVEDLASRVAVLKGRLNKQKVSVKLEHYWELADLRSRFAEFKWRIEQFAEDDKWQLERDQKAIEASWNDLMRAVDALLAALPDTYEVGPPGPYFNRNHQMTAGHTRTG